MDLIKNNNKELREYDENGKLTYYKNSNGYEKWYEQIKTAIKLHFGGGTMKLLEIKVTVDGLMKEFKALDETLP